MLHVLRDKFDFQGLQQAVLDQARLWNARNVLIEDTGSGTHLLQNFKRDGFWQASGITPRGNKEVRAHAVAAVIASGQVMLPLQASWLEDYLFELQIFPAGRYDDQVDSTTQALKWMTDYNGPEAWLRTINEVYRRRKEQG